ncbi:proteasome assembly chaperone family protein [Candidatus Micrarchaeota archaeon]|nr:proteasome assembly chaperone family protein [Candidatus Micrarchaeota archaeon]
MKETTIIEKLKEKKFKNGVLLTGLPGIGLIGQVVGRYLVEELKAKKTSILVSPHFPHQVFMTKKGGMRLIRNSFFVYRGKKHDVLILLGDIQAMSSVGQYEVAGAIIDYAQNLGIKEILTVGGYSTGKINAHRRIFAVATSEKMRTRLKKFGVIFGEARGSIVGAAGLLPSLSKLKGLEGSCIMGETHGGYVDTASARQIVQFLSKYLEIPINLKKLDERVEESQKVIKKVETDIQKSMSEFESGNTHVSYIR